MKKLIIFILIFAAAAGAGEFRFAVLGDSHFDNPEIFERLVQEINLLRPAFVIHTGNMIEGYTYDPEQIRKEWECFKKQIAPLTMPFYPVPGNRDIATTPLQAIFAEIWGKDKLYYSFDYRGSHFIILNTDYNLNYGTISADQMTWAERDLEKNAAAENIFVFMHRPLWRDGASNWNTFAALLKKYPNVRSVMAGHEHEYCFEEVDGLRCFILNASGRMDYYAPAVGYFHHFLMVSVEGTTVTEALIPAGSIKPADYVTRQEQDRASLYLLPPSGGQIPDPSLEPLNILYTFYIRNYSKEINVYTVRWETPNPAFTAEPREQALMLAPGRLEGVSVRLKAPARFYESYSLPYALIQTYYNTYSGESITLTSRHELNVPPRTVARFAKNPPIIDGMLDDTAWMSADDITDFKINRGGDPAQMQTWARTLFDEDYLYIGVHCAEPNLDKLVKLASPPIPFTWGDDEVEIFLDPEHDLQTFARAFVSAGGVAFSTLPEKGIVQPWFEHAVHMGKDYWAVEYKFPFSVLRQDDVPTSATTWGFNVRRHRQKPQREQSDWSKMSDYPNEEPWRFGILHFER